MPLKIFVLVILFALFVFLCGAGHLMRCLGAGHTQGFAILNDCTAFISFLTAVYLLPLVPNLMSTLDEGLQELIRLNEETEESRRKLITFMAFLCHEIRNPLFAVTSSISFMEDGNLTDEQERALRSIQQSTSLMLRLVNDVLDISKLDSGKLELEERHFDFHEMAYNVASSTETQIKSHPDVAFRFDMTPDVPKVLVGDSVRIVQVLYNLLSNAVKFTEKGVISFNVSIMDYDLALLEGVIDKENSRSSLGSSSKLGEDGDGDADSSLKLLQNAEDGRVDHDMDEVVLKVVVADTGPGISPDRIGEIFKPYSQKLSDYRKHGGTGLGLSIITKILRLMGGSIQVESEENDGATFTVYFPLRISHGPNEETTDDSKSIISKSLSSSRLPEITAPSLQSLPLINNQVSPAVDAAPRMACTTPATLSSQEEFSASSLPWMATSMEDIPSPCSPMLLSPTSFMNQSVLAIESLSSPISSRKRQLTKFNLPSNDNFVLVVDDNLLNRKLLGKMLSHFNLEHRFACDGQEAVDTMLQSRNCTGASDAPQFALIIMDLSMPTMDGCEATRVIRSYGMKLPILALTANAIEGSRVDALKAGATEFLTKPILRDDLHAKCFQYLSPKIDLELNCSSHKFRHQESGLLEECKD
jgi:signal transduction histidine kinase/CheY-like chemotaxis protein